MYRRRSLVVVVVIIILLTPLFTRTSSCSARGPQPCRHRASRLDPRFPSVQKPPRLAPVLTLLIFLYKWGSNDFTHRQASGRGPMNPPIIDVYRFLPDKSVLDNVIHSKALRRPVYASTTQGSVTRVWRIEAHGSMTQIAMVDWELRFLSFGDVQRKLDDVLVKSKGLFQREWVHYRQDTPTVKSLPVI